MSGQKWVVNSEHTRDQLHKHIDRMFDEHKYLVVSDIKTGKQRTSRQNAALHVYLTQLSTALNDAGLDMKKALKPSVDIPWSKDLAKEYLWRPIQKALLNKNSTTKAERTEYTEVYETLNRHTAEKWGISLPWPERDNG